MMTRRAFAGTLAGFAAAAEPSYALRTVPASIANRSDPVMAFRAIAAERLPRMMIATEKGPRQSIPISADGLRLLASSPIFELRRYECPPAARESCFRRAGIFPVLTNAPGVFLIPFDSLAAREKSWATLAADPEWIGLRSAVRLTEISIYAPIS